MDRAPANAGQLAAEVLREAWRCYRRHFGAIVGLSLVGSVERAFVQFAGDGLPGGAAVGLEVVVWGSRLLLAVLLVRWLLVGDERLRGVGVPAGLRRVGRYLRRHWPAAVLQLGGLAVAVAVLDLIPDLLVAPLVPPHAQATYWAVLLAVKNPTVIAFTFVWELALVHQALVRGGSDRVPVSAAWTGT